MTDTFRVGFTRDFLRPDGTVGLGDIGLGLVSDRPGIEWEFLPERHRLLAPVHISTYNGLALLGGRIEESSLQQDDQLTVIARYGVGYDNVDIDACTRHGIAVTITPDAVRRPMATAILTYILALSGRLLQKDRLTRSGGWMQRIDHMGVGLIGRTLGTIGLGNIGREAFKLAAPLGMKHIAHDPYADQETTPDIELVDLDTLFSTADFIVVTCALTPETHHLVNADRLAQMKPTAFLINTARGPIVDQQALTEALQQNRIAGAGLDVFEQEPVDPEDPILTLDNVIVTPHALGWTDQWIQVTGQNALGGILDVAAGNAPPFVVNRDVLESPLFKQKLANHAARSAT